MRGQPAERSQGFALIVVLWALVMIGLVITRLTAGGRAETLIARNMIANAEAAAAADGGVAAAIYHLTQGEDGARWAADGTAHTVRVGSSSVNVRCWDETSKVNPNQAPETLMSALLLAVGVDAARAQTLAAAIAGWHDMVRQTRPGGSGAAEYLAAGLDYGPPGAPFETIGELSRVLGMTPHVMSALRPHLTLWHRRQFPENAAADPVVAQAIEINTRLTGQPPPSSTRQRRITVTILATSRTPAGAGFTRHAAVQAGPGVENGVKVLAWTAEPEE